MLLSGSGSGLPAVGLGALGRADNTLLVTARSFLRRVGADGPVLLAMSTGRVSARGLTIPRLGVSGLFVVSPTRWWFADRQGERCHARGRTSDIIGTFATSDSVTVCFSETQTARFGTGQMNTIYVKAIIDGVLGHVRIGAAGFRDIAPAQPPLVLMGTHVGGYGTELMPGEPCVVALSGRGLCATGAGSVLLRPADHLRGVQIGGIGAYTTGGGWVGGGFGIAGALEGAAFASLMNTLTTRRHIDCVIRFVFDDAEATFSLSSDTPDRLQLDASALIAALRGPSELPNAQALRLTTVAHRPPAVGDSRALADRRSSATAVPRFCGHCGASREPAHAFCTGCGKPFNG